MEQQKKLRPAFEAVTSSNRYYKFRRSQVVAIDYDKAVKLYLGGDSMRTVINRLGFEYSKRLDLHIRYQIRKLGLFKRPKNKNKTI